MSSQRLRVFVSSRMQELQPERGAIRAALAEMHVETFVFEIDGRGARVTGSFIGVLPPVAKWVNGSPG